MDLQHLREFVTLAEIGSFIEASEIHFISQSTLSRHLQALEADLNIELFKRTTRHVEINEYGEMFLPYAKSIIEKYDKYRKELSIKLKEDCAEVNIGSIPSMIEYNIIDVFTSFQKKHPFIKIKIIEGDSLELKNLLQQGMCDIAFIREKPSPNNEFVTIPYAEDKLVAVLPSFHSLAKCNPIKLEQLSNEIFLLLPKNNITHKLCISKCRKAGFEPRIDFISHSPTNIIDLVGKGMGISLLTEKAFIPIMNVIESNISIVDITPRISTKINVVYVRHKELSIHAGMFLKHMRNYC